MSQSANHAKGERARYQRPQDWRGATINRARIEHKVSLQGVMGDATQDGSTTPLWEIGVAIEYKAPTASIYTEERSALPDRVASATGDVVLTIDIHQGRGSRKPGRSYAIECELGHLDGLAELLTAALMVARRDGVIPIAKGMRQWRAKLGS